MRVSLNVGSQHTTIHAPPACLPACLPACRACVQVSEYEAHERRVWGVDFSPVSPHTFASGSDDGTVKVGAWAAVSI